MPFQKKLDQYKNKYLLVDGMAMVFRGFYAIPRLTSADGKPTNAVYGFFLILINLIKQIQPTHIVICFDRHEVTKRKEEYTEYKATRTKAPDELYQQIPYIKEGIAAFNFNLIEKVGYEADDLLATIACEKAVPDTINIIYTGDLDLLQLADHYVKILTPHNQKQGILMGSKEVQEKYGFTPDQIPDYKGLHGDPSDNLPGVKGIGSKTATKLLAEYKTLENIYAYLNDLTPKMREKFEEHKEMAFMCKKMATLHTNLSYETPKTNFEVQHIDLTKGTEFLNNYSLRTLATKIPELQSLLKIENQDPSQLDLFTFVEQ